LVIKGEAPGLQWGAVILKFTTMFKIDIYREIGGRYEEIATVNNLDEAKAIVERLKSVQSVSYNYACFRRSVSLREMIRG
jgi:hypothetical protein